MKFLSSSKVMQTNSTHAKQILARSFPEFASFRKLEELSSGYINHVWRVSSENDSVILKFARRHSKFLPELELPRKRIFFESQAIDLLNTDDFFANIISDRCRPPYLLAFSEKDHALIMEDVGENRLSFEEALSKGSPNTVKRASQLGSFVGSLHSQTANSKSLAKAFNNTGIQQIRYDSQYRNIEKLCAENQLAPANELGKAARKTGNEFLQPGKCLIMGDLWPRSILAGKTDLRLIDWEFVHYGSPAQDIGHFMAHLWLLNHFYLHTGQEANARLANECMHKFTEGYRQNASRFLTSQEIYNSSIHFGAEILVRTVGNWKADFHFAKFKNSDKAIIEALKLAKKSMLAPEGSFISALLSC
jgi:5-methylthioribose kinase